jgi:molecular chaperone IbpA
MFRNADFDNFFKYAVGFDTIFGSMSAVLDSSSVHTNYPPHNLVEVERDKYLISMAVAGYSKDDLAVEWKDRNLSVTGLVDHPDKQVGVIHNGIAKRKFTKMFALGEYIEVDRVSLKDGMLSITLTRVVPESERLKLMDIHSD